MKRSRAGTSLFELIFAVGLSLLVISVGYRTYVSFMRVEDIERKRESISLAVQNLMGRIKQDVRSASSISGSGGVLTITGSDTRIIYRNKQGSSCVERIANRRFTHYDNVEAVFAVKTGNAAGVDVKLTSEVKARRRPIRIEVTSFISPRNR